MNRSWLGKVEKVGEDGDDVVLEVSFNEGKDNFRELRLDGDQLGFKPQIGQLFEMRAGAEPDPASADVIRIDGTEIITNAAIAC